MKKILFCIATASCVCATLFQIRAASIVDVTATIQFSNGQAVTLTNFSDPVGVAPSETVIVTVQFPASAVGEDVAIESLDGGRVNGGSQTVHDDGFVSFNFRATQNCGQNRVVIRHGSQALRLQFWVLSSNPDNNPPVITPANPEG